VDDQESTVCEAGSRATGRTRIPVTVVGRMAITVSSGPAGIVRSSLLQRSPRTESMTGTASPETTTLQLTFLVALPHGQLRHVCPPTAVIHHTGWALCAGITGIVLVGAVLALRLRAPSTATPAHGL
jgi:hypothetical protein